MTQPTGCCMAWHGMALQMRLDGWQLERESAGRSVAAAGVYPKRGKFCVWRRLKPQRGQSDDGRSRYPARRQPSGRRPCHAGDTN